MVFFVATKFKGKLCGTISLVLQFAKYQYWKVSDCWFPYKDFVWKKNEENAEVNSFRRLLSKLQLYKKYRDVLFVCGKILFELKILQDSWKIAHSKDIFIKKSIGISSADRNSCNCQLIWFSVSVSYKIILKKFFRI